MYLIIHNVSQVQRLLDDVHEALSQHLGDEDVTHGQQAVWTEGLDQHKLKHHLADGS